MKEAENLDLDSYKPYLRDFASYAQNENLFEVENVFSGRKKEMAQQKAYGNIGKFFRLKVTSPDFIKHIKEQESMITGKAAAAIKVSPQKLIRFEKEMPPDANDIISEDEIKTFTEVGQVGWKYLSDNVFSSNWNTGLLDRITLVRRIR